MLSPRTACGMSSSTESCRIAISAPPSLSSEENKWRSYCHLLRRTSCNDCQLLTRYCARLIHIISIRHRPSWSSGFALLLGTYPDVAQTMLCIPEPGCVVTLVFRLSRARGRRWWFRPSGPGGRRACGCAHGGTRLGALDMLGSFDAFVEHSALGECEKRRGVPTVYHYCRTVAGTTALIMVMFLKTESAFGNFFTQIMFRCDLYLGGAK